MEAELHGSDPARAIERLDQEQDNIRAALRWWISQGPVERAARLAGAVWQLWQVRGQLREGRRWLREMLPHVAALPGGARSKVLFGLGTLAHA